MFRNLIVHRKVINHPHLVKDSLGKALNPKAKQMMQLSPRQGHIELSAKLKGLVDLLRICGIIQSDEEEAKNAKKEAEVLQAIDEVGAAQEEEGHRVLLFCQMLSYLDIIVDQVLRPRGIKYVQLMSKHSGQERYDIVENFNADASIKVCIMTTAVGGLGLNLTGADTVIFMEHDWNPMKDMQAIDRAHRIGQRRRVNVYRLIVRDTLEEKILGLQRFKKNLEKCLI